MTPTCTNCGSHVTDRFMLVFAPDDVDNPDRCVNCPEQRKHGFAEAVQEGRI